ncbi:hypothetical protein R3X26_09155 [Vibrio sp. TH_r3]|uniref:hypothetical protein n=1 Tax=Vibrio sp. TH_r3 TaxID=3082084 RepID=UPI002952D621|nr:hypothetical protein [Vibrio sp. TH_r3]MDV7104567.1 hypothetical protein [Vibrio sp. TH_r3]
MKQLGLKRLLLISVVLLVGFSVSISSYISYVEEEVAIKDIITTSTKEYVASKAQMVEVYLKEKVDGVGELGELYKNKEFTGNNDDDYIAVIFKLLVAC